MTILKTSTDPASLAAKEFNVRTWTKQGTWPGAFLWFFVILESFTKESTGQILDRRLGITDYACIDDSLGTHDCFIGRQCFKEMRTVVEQGYATSGIEYFGRYADLCARVSDAWMEFARSISEHATSLAATSNRELLGMLQEYFRHMRASGAFMDTIIVLGDVLGDIVGKSSESLLHESGIEDPTAYRLFLEIHSEEPLSTNLSKADAAIRTMASHVREVPHLLKVFTEEDPSAILKFIKAGHKDLYVGIRGYIDSFGWMNTYSFSGHEFTSGDIVGLIQDELFQATEFTPELFTPRTAPDAALETAIRSIEIPGELRSLLRVTRILANINISKDDAHQITWRDIRPLVETVATRLGCTITDLTFLTPREIEDALLGKHLDRSLPKLRAEGWSMLKTSDTVRIVQGREECMALREQLHRVAPRNLAELRGRPIFPGRVKGVVRVVRSAGDCSKVNSGDILVATNTNPDFIPAMRKAAAFITDTGNLICHAVIAAREFRKPCVISTQIATEVFRDGDYVDVDGTEGIVTRISSVEVRD